MERSGSESGHLMLITPERVFYAGLLGRPRERCSGAFHVYVALEGALWLSTADGREVHGELLTANSNIAHTVTSDHRSAICVTMEPESAPAGTFEKLAKRLSGTENASFARRIRGAYEHLLGWTCGNDVDSAELDRMCFGEALPRRILDPRVTKAIARIERFSGEPVTATACAAEAGLLDVALPAFVQAGDRHLLPRLPRLEARAASAAFRQPGPQPRPSRARHRLSRLHAFLAFDPQVLRAEAARDLLRLARSCDLPQRRGGAFG